MTSSTRPPDIDGMIGGGQARRRRRNATRAGIAAVAVLAIGGGAYGIAQLGDGDADSAPPIANEPSSADVSTSPSTDDGTLPVSGPIEPGTYQVPASESSGVAFRITFPEGWTASDGGHAFSKHPDQPGEVGIEPFAVDEIFTDACAGTGHANGVPVAVGPGTDALVQALREQKHGAAVSQPVETTLGDHPATRVDLTVPRGMDVSSCRVTVGLQIWETVPRDYLVVLEGQTVGVFILDVDGEHQVLTASRNVGASAEDLAELQQVLDSIEIGS